MGKNIKTYTKELIQLALPIIMGHIGFTFIMAGDVFVAGKYSTDVLAAVSLSGAITSLVFMFGIGLIVSVSPVLSNRLGARKSTKKFFYPTILFSQIVAIVTMFAIWGTIPVMERIGFNPNIISDIKIYTFIFGFSSFGAYLHAALKEFLQAYEIVFFPNFIAILGIFLNIALNWILTFGFGPIPSLGVVGLAIASVLIRTIMGLGLFIFCLYYFNLKYQRINNKYYSVLIKVGLPISVAVTLEFLAFNSMAILMGRVNSNYAAAQNILNVISSASFMVPLSISNAIAVKVGFANGAGNLEDVKKYGFVGVGLSVGFMAICGIFYALFPQVFAGIFTNDKNLIDIIVPIMYIVAAFQCFDGLQASCGGILKGLKKTFMVSVANFIGYILIGISLGSYLAFKMHLNLFGFWIGIAISSACVGLVLIIEILKTYNKLKREANLK
ncbi:MATE family efflux transporter [bacterium]|nr:MATE family efflux transporter [bacterium]